MTISTISINSGGIIFKLFMLLNYRYEIEVHVINGICGVFVIYTHSISIYMYNRNGKEHYDEQNKNINT